MSAFPIFTNNHGVAQLKIAPTSAKPLLSQAMETYEKVIEGIQGLHAMEH
jgi:hypothetical protein